MDVTKASVRVFISQTVNSLLVFLGFTYLARTEGANNIGIFFLFQSSLSILAIIADLGIRRAVEKRISEGDQPHRMFSAGLLVKLIPLALITLLIFIFKSQISIYIGADVALLLALAIIAQELFRLSLSTLRGELRVVTTSDIKILYHLTWIGGGILLTTLGYGIDSLMYTLVAGYLTLAIYSFWISDISFVMPTMSHIKSIFSYSKFNFATRLGGQFYNWVDIAIIGYFLTQSHVGAYEIAWKITVLSLLISKSIGTSIFPQISKWSNNQDNKRIQSLFRAAILPPLLLSIPLFVGSVILAEDILIIVYSPEFAIAAIPLIILSAEKVFQGVHTIVGRTLLAIDQPHLAARATILSLIVNVFLNIILIYWFGLLGAAIATGTASLMNVILHYHYLTKFIDFDIPRKNISYILSSSLFMGSIVFSIKMSITISSIPVLIGVITFGGIIYLIPLMFVPDIRSILFRATRSLV